MTVIVTSQRSPQLVRITSTKSQNDLQYSNRSQHNATAGTTTKTLKKSKSVQFDTSTTNTSNFNHHKFSAMQSEYLETSTTSSSLSSSHSPCSYYTLSDDTKNELWWSPKELKAISKQRKEMIKQFLAKQKQEDNKDKTVDGDNNNNTGEDEDVINQQFVSLYKSCASMSVTQVLRLKSTKELISRMSLHSKSNSVQEKDIVAVDCLRGLEGKLSKSLSRQNKRHVSSMLSLMNEKNGQQQQQQQGARIGSLSVDNSVSANLAKSVRASEIMARVLAQIDAKESSY